MTSTVNRPTAEVETSAKPTRAFPFAERMSRLAAYDTIRRLIDTCDLPVPCTIQLSPGVDGPLGIFVDTDAEREAWKAHGFDCIAGRPTAVMSTEASRKRMAETAALIDEVTAEPCCNTRKRGAVTTHEPGCKYLASLPRAVDHIHIGDGKFACGAKTGFSSDDPSRADCPACREGVRRLLDVLATDPIDEVTAACASCGGEMTHRAGCPTQPHECDDCTPPPVGDDHAIRSRDRILEALADGPAVLSNHPHAAVQAALRAGVIRAWGPSATGRTVYALAFDPEAAAQIPVVVIDVPKPTVHLLHADWSRECDAEDGHGSISLANVTCPECLASRATPVEPDAREYVPVASYTPVPMPTGVQANAAECARLRGGTVHHVPEGVHPRGREPHEPTDHGVPIVDVLTVDPELDVIERDDNAVMGRVLPPQMLFAEAADRLADAMLGEASGE